MNRFLLLSALALVSATPPAFSDDWPQWQGPNRDAISQETGLLQEWPESGPALAWKQTELGGGYSAPAVAGGRLYGISKRELEESVWARSEKDGTPIWETSLGSVPEGGMRQGIEGAGCTPTVDGDRLYVIGHGGAVVCLQASDGKPLWRREMIQDFGGRLPTWRFNESPLIDGNKVICTPGGTENTMVALDKHTGELIWTSHVPDSADAPAVPRQTPASANRAPSSDTSNRETAADASTEAAPEFEPKVLIEAETEWKYLDDGRYPGSEWTQASFDDAGWKAGKAQFGYGDRDEETLLDDASENYPTYYFRKAFEVAAPSDLKPLILRLLRDDGAIVYLNGEEIIRDNMPEGTITRETYAASTTRSESDFYGHELPANKLATGINLLAVEVHQADGQSSDVSFDLELREKVPGKDRVGPPPPSRGRRGGGGGGGFRFGESGAAYASAIAIEAEGQRQYVQFTSKTLAGISAEDGKLLWRYDKPSNRSGINCSTPIFHEGHIFAASAYGAGGGLARLSKDDTGQFKAEELWFSSDMENHHGGMVVIDGCLYGANGGNGGGYLACLDFKSGEVLWDERDREKRRAEKGSIAYADGRIYYRTEEGDVLLLEPSREAYLERGRFEQPERTRQPAWTHPVIANGRLYIRDQDTLYCYNVSQSAQ